MFWFCRIIGSIAWILTQYPHTAVWDIIFKQLHDLQEHLENVDIIIHGFTSFGSLNNSMEEITEKRQKKSPASHGDWQGFRYVR